MNGKKILWGIAIIGFLIGLIGLVQRITGGHTLAAYSTYVPWGIWVAVYAMMIGVSAGAFLVASLAYGFQVQALLPLGRTALLTALAALAGGLLAIWLDLGHPARFWKLLVSTNFGSMMGLMAWFYTLYGIVLLALLYLTLKDPAHTAVKWLGQLGVILVVIFGGAEGALFGVVSAQATWESGLTPILFLVEGALSGVGLVMFLAVVLGQYRPDSGQLLRWLTLGFLLGVIVLEWAEYSTGLYAGIPAKVESLRIALFGPFWWVFWIIHVGLGLLAPLLLLSLSGRNKTSLATAGGLIAVTAVSTKLNLVIPALIVPEFEALKMAFTGTGLTFDYFPTTMEWLLTLWIVSVAGLVFLLADRFLFAPKATE